MFQRLLDCGFRFIVFPCFGELPTQVTVVRRSLGDSSINPRPVVFRVFLWKLPCIVTAQNEDNSVFFFGVEAASRTRQVTRYALSSLYLPYLRRESRYRNITDLPFDCFRNRSIYNELITHLMPSGSFPEDSTWTYSNYHCLVLPSRPQRSHFRQALLQDQGMKLGWFLLALFWTC